MASECARPCRTVTRNVIDFAVPLDAVENDLSDIQFLGRGLLGDVIRVPKYVYKGHAHEVAIKKLYEPFRDEKVARRAFREIRLLQLMRHENIVRLVDIYTPDKSPGSLKSVYIVTEFAGLSLHAISRPLNEKDRVQLKPIHHQLITYQLLRALKHIHSANVIHRDLKMSNVALTRDCQLTVLDFGQTEAMHAIGDQLPANDTTRFYSSPEVLCWDIGEYDKQADMWSLACILAELCLGHVLFQGDTLIAQYEAIVKLCGSPDDILMAKIKRLHEEIYSMIEHLKKHSRKCFGEVFPKSFSPELTDFLDRALVLDPERRMTVQEGLEHPYVREFSQSNDEPVVNGPIKIEGENDHKRTVGEWQEMLWLELQRFNPLAP